MKKNKLNKTKIFILFGIMGLYIIIAGGLLTAVSMGIIKKAPPTIEEISTTDVQSQTLMASALPQLKSAEIFFDKNFVRSDGHIDLYISKEEKNNFSEDLSFANLSFTDNNTNSEAASYYLLWKAQANNKTDFDKELDFMEQNMIQKKYGYLMWRLNSTNQVESDGSNIATDADLRAIKALLIAEKKWKDKKYTNMIDQLALGLELVAVTKDGYLAPYAGVSGGSSKWTTEEVWLSYSDFTVFKELSIRRGEPWTGIYEQMKVANLNAQITNGLYNSMLTVNRTYGNGIDGGGYSINSMWVMVRNAESNDSQLMQSAKLSLQFYKDKFSVDNEIYAQYGSNGDPLSPADTAWVYALVGRAAIALDDQIFSEQMMQKLIEHQVANNQSELFGAFPEERSNQIIVGQFTMQESIITLQKFNEKK